ncbi:MAG: hypothetical protein AABZ77_06555 [Chloroflexota bacterium]
MKFFRFIAVTLAVLLSGLIPTGLALADTISNDVISGGNDTFITGSSTTINYKIDVTNGVPAGDPSGRNDNGANPATVTIVKPAAVTATPASLIFTGGGSQSVLFTSATPGDYAISVTVTGGKSGSLWNTAPAAFTLHVLSPPPPPRDTTPPVVTAALSPSAKVAPNWNNEDVTITWSASDPESGIASGPTPASQNVTTEGVGQVFTSTATNGAGLIGTGNVTLNIDKTAPTITGPRTPVANSYGWNNTNVTVSFTAFDTLSGVDHYSGPTTLSDEGAGQSVTGNAFDYAKNKGTTTVSGINIDKTAPAVTATAVPVANGAGWNNTDVIVTFSATDNLSGVATVDPPVTVTVEGAGQVITGNATDKAGNIGTVSITLNIDKTKPVVTATAVPAANGAGWNNTDVTVTFSATDTGGSGIATVSPAVTVATEGAGQVITGSATDVAGNTGSANVTLNIDKTPPSVSITGPSVVLQGTSAFATVVASDALSGLVVNPSGTLSLDTSTPGAKTVTIIVTDKAGNTNSATLNYTVWGVNGPFAPLVKNGNGTGQFKAGSTIPVKFQFTDGTNLITTANGTVSIGSASADFRWDSTAQQYIANLKTASTPGTFDVVLTVNGVGSKTLLSGITLR